MRLLVIAVVALGLATAPASAQSGVNTDKFSLTYQRCITYGETHDTVAIAESECNARELRVQDARLNEAYKITMARMGPSRRADLRTDERNWIAARDQKCTAYENEDREACLIDQTMKRVAYLERAK